jgi:hypothetical protein
MTQKRGATSRFVFLGGQPASICSGGPDSRRIRPPEVKIRYMPYRQGSEYLFLFDFNVLVPAGGCLSPVKNEMKRGLHGDKN